MPITINFMIGPKKGLFKHHYRYCTLYWSSELSKKSFLSLLMWVIATEPNMNYDMKANAQRFFKKTKI